MSEEKVKELKVLQSKVLKRWLSKREYEKLVEGYKVHRMTGNRKLILKASLTFVQRRALHGYLYQLDENLNKLVEKLGVKSVSAIHQSAGRAALKVLYQVKDEINLEDRLKRGVK